MEVIRGMSIRRNVGLVGDSIQINYSIRNTNDGIRYEHEMWVGVKRGFAADLGVLLDSVADGFLARGFEIDECCLDTLVCLRYLRQVAICTTVDVIHANDVRVRSKSADHSGGRGRTRCECKGVRSAGFQRCKGLLKGIAVWVARTGVFEALWRTVMNSASGSRLVKLV